MDSTLKSLKAALEAIRDNGVECVGPDRPAAGDTFDAVEMQRMPVHEAFYSAGSIGGGWQMPPMQKHGVYSYSLRGLPTRRPD